MSAGVIRRHHFSSSSGKSSSLVVCNSSSHKIFYKSTLTDNYHRFPSRLRVLPRTTVTPSLFAFNLYYCLPITTRIYIFSISSILFNPPILFIYLYRHSLYSSSSTHIRYPVSILYYCPPHQSHLQYNIHTIISDISNYLRIRYILYSLFITPIISSLIIYILSSLLSYHLFPIYKHSL